MMSARSDRGAVHILVLVITLVIGLLGWALWYQAYSDDEKHKAELATATTVAERSNSDYLNVKEAYNDLAKIVGGELAPLASPTDEDADPETWKKKYVGWHSKVKIKLVEELNYFGGDKSIDTLLGAFAPAEAKLTMAQAEVDSLKRDVATARTEADGSRRANTELADQHNKALNTKNQDLTTNRERLETQLANSEKKNEENSKDFKRVADEFDAAVAKSGEEIRAIKAAFEGHDREVTVLKSYLKTARVWEQPDGNVIEVDARAGMCWIDLGSRHALRRGTRFKSYGIKKGGVREDHGFVVVHDITVDRALCSIESGAPIMAGDHVTNPHFDRAGRMNFFFLGKLPGRFDNQTAKNILEDFGAQVNDKVSVHIDFIVLGDDPNPEAIGENARPDWFKDTPEYNDALRWGIETIRARDLEAYLQF